MLVRRNVRRYTIFYTSIQFLFTTPHVLTVILRRSRGNRRLSPLSISFSLISGLLSSSFIALHSLHNLSISSFLYFELCEQHRPPFFLFANSYSIIQAV